MWNNSEEVNTVISKFCKVLPSVTQDRFGRAFTDFFFIYAQEERGIDYLPFVRENEDEERGAKS